MNPQNPITRRRFLSLSAAGACALCLAACARQPAPAPEDYWKTNHKNLLDNFDQILNPARKEIVDLCGEPGADSVLAETRTGYEALMPDVPYIGGDDNALTETLYLSAAALAFYRVMLAHDQTLEDTGRILYHAIESLYQRNATLIRAFGGNPTGKAAQEEYRRIARWSEQSPYPGDWKAVFVEGDGGQTFDFGVDYTECGLVKFYQAQNAAELAPYLCLGDFPYSQVMDSGLVRTSTIARGGQRCDFRFKKGRPIQMEWAPEFLKD
jgi:hypothetical protein